jgi:hypothetical protein
MLITAGIFCLLKKHNADTKKQYCQKRGIITSYPIAIFKKRRYRMGRHFSYFAHMVCAAQAIGILGQATGMLGQRNGESYLTELMADLHISNSQNNYNRSNNFSNSPAIANPIPQSPCPSQECVFNPSAAFSYLRNYVTHSSPLSPQIHTTYFNR